MKSQSSYDEAVASYEASKAASAAAYRDLISARDITLRMLGGSDADVTSAAIAEERAEIAYREAADDVRIARDAVDDAYDAWDRSRDGHGNFRD